MTPYWSAGNLIIYLGDVRDVLPQLPEAHFHCAVTSPPYWALRDYGVAGQMGSEKSPEEYVRGMVAVFGMLRRALRDDGLMFVDIGDSYFASGQGWGDTKTTNKNHPGSRERQKPEWPDCGLKPGDLCGIPWRLALALQADGWWLRMDNVWAKRSPMPESLSGWRWEKHRVKVGKSVRASGIYNAEAYGNMPQGDAKDGRIDGRAEWADCPGCPKCGPNGGLVLRKGSWRATRSHEFIFQLAKSANYYADGEAVRQKSSDKAHRTYTVGHKTTRKALLVGGKPTGRIADRGDWKDGAPGGLANLRSVWTIGPEPSRLQHYACVDAETECLTMNGWRRFDSLICGTSIAAYNQERRCLQWEPIEDLSVYELANQKVVSVQHRDMSMVMTPDHRCLIERRSGQFIVKKAEELLATDKILTAAQWEVIGTSPFSEGFAELLGWYIAEGHECKGSMAVEIYQSQSANPEKVARIRQLLVQAEAEFQEATAFRKWRGKDSISVAFRVKGFTAHLFRQIVPDKAMPVDLLSWSAPLIEAFLNGMIAGDGNVRQDGRRFFTQKKREPVDMLQAACVRLGLPSTMCRRAGGLWALYIARRPSRTFRATNGKPTSAFTWVDYTGTVWCPTVASGFWMARRSGRTCITGNSFPSKLPTICIKAGTSERGCCPQCGANWARVVERIKPPEDVFTNNTAVNDSRKKRGFNTDFGKKGSSQRHQNWRDENPDRTIGWRPTCSCTTGIGDFHDSDRPVTISIPKPIPCRVLDPFGGTGTTLLAAYKLRRAATMIELSEPYCAMAAKRLEKAMGKIGIFEEQG